MSQTLLIVESPAKAKTLKKYLGTGYDVKASVGHVRDLPTSDLGVDVAKDFAVKYVTIPGKEKVLKELKDAAKKADVILLAPDPDREGEAIAWHVAQAIGAKGKTVQRVMFNEITKRAVLEALKHPMKLDENRFNSQQARRILDRLVGYNLSPFLWKKVKYGLSAGRVQSVAVRVVLEREEKIRAFTPREYWVIDADVQKGETAPFAVKLVRIGDKKAEIDNAKDAEAVRAALVAGKFRVLDIQTKTTQRKPSPPFITSTLQQAASGQLRMSPKQTMAVAQQLYEGVDVTGEGPEGLITYMRTDAVRIAPEAQAAAAEYIRETWGERYLPEKPNFYKSGKGAQEAHEAIRPTRIDLPPEKLEGHLKPEQFRLYRLIWRRFIASQMVPAELSQKTVEVENGTYVLAVTTTEETFAGYMRAWRDGGDIEADRRTEEEDDQFHRRATDGAAPRVVLPTLAIGDELAGREVRTEQRFTQPPPRFSEAALIRELEELGIGRPSTYASIMTTIQDKGYVEKISGALHPTPLGEVVTRLLIDAFPVVLDVGFTASMEEHLDEVEEGRMAYTALLHEFYNPFEKTLHNAQEHLKDFKLKGQATDIACEKCGHPMGIKFGRGGAYLACSNYPTCKSSKNFKKDENGKIVVVEDETTEVACEKCGSPMIKREGRWGPYLACSGYPDCKNIVSLKAPKAKPRYEVHDAHAPACGECQSKMVLRVSRYGSHFWSCSKYPKCKGTAPYDTGFSCMTPDCKGTLVERLPRKRGAKKTPFWACNTCDFLTGDRPVPTPCPKCAHAWVAERIPTGAPEGSPHETRCPKCGHVLVSADPGAAQIAS
ncbi:MAG: type I DNA topoisomerase [Deltaproteobacteria bacterium]|nr:type I DNA topoisomerase [Deltaproteobacteria bacterium]